MTNDEILATASYEAIRALDDIGESGNPDQKRAAKIAAQGLLALRDSVKRPEHKDVYALRMQAVIQAVATPNPKPEKKREKVSA